jgi:uncharacterized membrane protein YcaP (DUF421 family)
MDSVIKSLVVYFVLWLVIRSTGRRTLGQLTVFDFILFLIIGGAAQRALMAQDYSLTHAFLVIATSCSPTLRSLSCNATFQASRGL